MTEQALTLIFSTIPQFAFASILYWWCSKQADKQREAHQQQMKEMFDLAGRVIDRVNDVIELAREFRDT